DGHLNTVDSFIDKNGRKIAEFSYEQDGLNIRILSTYYVYDDLGNLRYILTPKIFTNIASFGNYQANWLLNDFLQQGDAGQTEVELEIANNVLVLKTGLQSLQLNFPNKI